MSSKQINYWLEFDGFLQVAQKALELGCTIIQEDMNAGTVTEGGELALITDEMRVSYYFHLPGAGNIAVKSINSGERLDRFANECGNSIIEAGYSRIIEQDKKISRNRLFLSTGYYDDDGNYIYTPDCIVKVYNSLARLVKKLAPYTELTDSYTSIKDDNYGQTVEFKHKEYVSPLCLNLRNNEGYSLWQGF
ncbi:MAG: hypothetical protein K2N06_09400 [Oscillospiraceae bacterium]|nr:hypothetical protein [Oscillospiraceae bacterium]